jgi:predicted permease
MLVSSMPDAVPSLRITGAVNFNVLAFALAVTVVTGLVFGLAPAMHASRLDLQALLNRDNAGGGRRASGWLRGSLLGVQAMVCTVLLISAALLLRAVYAAETLEPGFSYRNVGIVSFDLRGAGLESARATAFQQELLDRVAALPGVDGVAQVSRTPLSPGRSQTMVRLPGQPQWREIDVNTVSSDYFRVLDLPIVAGRTFTRADLDGPARTAIVTAATAQRFWPGENPIGRVLAMGLGPDRETPLEIVGVAADAQVVHLGERDTTYMYLPADRGDSAGLAVLVRGRGDVATLAPAIRATARELALALVVTVKPLEENLSFWRTLSRLIAGVSGSLSLLALMLASVGVYAVVSYVVSQRLREMGIRLMLGATGPDVRNLILRQTLRPVAIGILLGVGGAAGAGQVLQSVLFGVSPFDPLAFVAAPLLLLAVGVAASLAPTRQVLTRDPLATLRLE